MASAVHGHRRRGEAGMAVLLLAASALSAAAPSARARDLAGVATASTVVATSAVVTASPVVATSTVVTTSPVIATSTVVTTSTIHGPYGMTADQCAVCHRSHRGAAVGLLTRRGAQSTLCLTCHDGTGAPDVAAPFTDAGIPANDPADRSYYGHDVLVVTTHSAATVDEFGGVSNRHSECGDCHNSHRAGGPDGSSTPAGQSASGALAGISGVAVVNGPAGTAPGYTFLDGITTPVQLEYQLCLKCHSGFTVLPSDSGFTPSRYELDKGVEFNPNNPSYHPVEAPGTNQSPAMVASLAGASPYKRWNFTTGSTVRCGHCHADDGATGPDLPTHRSANRGILTANYADRTLKPAGAPYAAVDFALCYLCHAESPFVSEGADRATNFPYHGPHVSNLDGQGTGGTDIDIAGSGQGNAICAECHYRIHSATYSVGGQRITGARLVNFAPNVMADNGELSWTPAAGGGGTCTLTCHGRRHDAERY